MARPKKIKSPPTDNKIDTSDKTPPEDLAWMNPLSIQGAIDRLRVDPFNDEPLACVLAPVLLDRATDAERESVGNLFAEAVRICTPEQLSGFFSRVAKMAENVKQPHRNARAYFGYARFIEETGREPSKPELKAYLLARPEIYKGMPADDAKSQWTDLWRDCGLLHLADRRVRTKP